MPIGDLLAQITGEPSPTNNDMKMSLPPKRKPEDQMRRPIDKLQKTASSSANSSRPLPQYSKPSPNNGRKDEPYAGTAARARVGYNERDTPRKGQTAAPAPNLGAPKAPPKKGSFAEIMARGKVAQETLGEVGKISHKKIEKAPTKREREEMMSKKSSQMQKNIGPNGKFHLAGIEAIREARRNGPNVSSNKGGKPGNGVNTSGKSGKKATPPPPEKKIKKAALATTGYTGTARPKPGGSGPSKSSASTSSSRYDRNGPDRYRDERRSSSGARYAYISEEEEDEDEDEEQDYESESDMEAAAFEVDEEEEAATRIARREDAEALAEENRLKREKEEKRRRLTAMAKARR